MHRHHITNIPFSLSNAGPYLPRYKPNVYGKNKEREKEGPSSNLAAPHLQFPATLAVYTVTAEGVVCVRVGWCKTEWAFVVFIHNARRSAFPEK